jgi:hypothetical protein
LIKQSDCIFFMVARLAKSEPRLDPKTAFYNRGIFPYFAFRYKCYTEAQTNDI